MNFTNIFAQNHRPAFLFLTLFSRTLLYLSQVTDSAPNPPTALIKSWSCSSVYPYLSCSLRYLISLISSSPFPWVSNKAKLAFLPSSL